MADEDETDEMPCVWCTSSKRRCVECRRQICAKHACAGSCCLRCIEALHTQVALGRYCTTAAEELELARIGGERASGYGELTSQGFRALANVLELGVNDVYVDLGSGLGRTVLLAAREFSVRESIGIELAETRHELAVAALEQETAALPCTFRLGDVCDEVMWDFLRERNVTVAFANNVLFGDGLQQTLGRRIEECTTLRAVAVLRPWGAEGLRGFRSLPQTLCVESSWRAPDELHQVGRPEPGSPVHLYERLPQPVVTSGEADS